MADQWEDAAKEVKVTSPASGSVSTPTSADSSGDPWESAAKEVIASPRQSSHQSPTFMDRISTEMNQGGAALEPDKVASGLRDSLSRSAQAYSRLRGGGSPQFSDVIDSVPLVGPMAHDAYTKLMTPGQRIEGLTDFGMMALPELAERGPAIAESMGRPLSAVRGGLSGGAKTFVTPIEYGMHKLPIPAPLAGAAAGHFGGSMLGPLAGTIGGVVGGMAPVVKGAIEGGKRALSLYDIQHMPAPEPRPTFQGHDFTPPSFSNDAPVGNPGAVLPSGSIVGPAAPSVANPPLPRGLPPRTPLWERAGVPGTPNAGTPDAGPIYPASPILDSGHVVGPRPSLATEPNGGTVVNGQPLRVGPASGTGGRPVISQPDLDTLNQQLRDSLKARGVGVPDTPASVRARANTNRAKFDENGVNKQLKPKK